MKRQRLSGLIALNAALLVALAFVTLSPSADAQARRPGDYLLAGGQMQSESSNVIYILDTANLEILGLVLDDNRKEVRSAIWHDIKKDLKQGASR
jgi:hypothetical protein